LYKTGIFVPIKTGIFWANILDIKILASESSLMRAPLFPCANRFAWLNQLQGAASAYTNPIYLGQSVVTHAGALAWFGLAGESSLSESYHFLNSYALGLVSLAQEATKRVV
jgi:hypothetical protein